METIINVAKTYDAIKIIEEFSKKELIGKMILVRNLHLKKLNSVYGQTIFLKNDAFINSETLWAATQPFGEVGSNLSHNTHNLKPREIIKSFQMLSKSKNIKSSYYGRFIVITMSGNTLFDIAVVIDPKSENFSLPFISNKIVSIFPKFK